MSLITHEQIFSLAGLSNILWNSHSKPSASTIIWELVEYLLHMHEIFYNTACALDHFTEWGIGLGPGPWHPMLNPTTLLRRRWLLKMQRWPSKQPLGTSAQRQSSKGKVLSSGSTVCTMAKISIWYCVPTWDQKPKYESSVFSYWHFQWLIRELRASHSQKFVLCEVESCGFQWV